MDFTEFAVTKNGKKRIILNKGTYKVGSCGFVSTISDIFPEFTVSVLNDNELEIRNRGEWQLVASGKYSYMLTKELLLCKIRVVALLIPCRVLAGRLKGEADCSRNLKSF